MPKKAAFLYHPPPPAQALGRRLLWFVVWGPGPKRVFAVLSFGAPAPNGCSQSCRLGPGPKRVFAVLSCLLAPQREVRPAMREASRRSVDSRQYETATR